MSGVADMVSWQPIDTCDKVACDRDNPVLLLIEPQGIVYVGFWGKSMWISRSEEAWRVKWNHEAPVDMDSRWEPTHWLPLPKWIPAKI